MAKRYQGVRIIYLGPPAFGALHLEPEAVPPVSCNVV